ncbi:DeoR/GlpR family DNA-binding transcription regulator [Salinibacterium sp. ZJ70]|uniref:DeoR/GlpR family DNA-binding transcription regulator n=1 Tax=Salinibacterium sp. ZJ70 TaxID=2708084 RepID=UPI0014241F97|nr:DeoR/GlpR family DNA-binding transcription regulator [Salinibacterium sp. ZJ70]
MKKQDRRHQLIAELLRDREFATTPELAQAVGVSEVTLRRDLRHLEQTGMLVRQHGGAQLANRIEAQSRFAERELLNADVKAAIGNAAAALIDIDEHVAFNDGSTVMRVAEALLDRNMPASVTTNALNIALTLSDSAFIDVWVLGGLVRRASFATFNAGADPFEGRRFDTAILGVESLDSIGAALDHPYDLAVAKAMIDRAERVIVVADSSKWDRRGRVELCPWAEVDVLVTNEITPEQAARITDQGVSLVIADPS